MSKSKKKSNKKAHTNVSKKKKIKKSTLIISVALAVVIVAVIATAVILKVSNSVKNSQLYNYSWTSVSATNSSGDEVDMSEIYNVNYTTYQGTLNFNEDGTFSFWLTPGEADDGTHTGTYDFVDSTTINAQFDDGTETTFTAVSNNGEVSAILISYDDYEVTFTKN
jgi:hypothetical protein